MITMYMYIVTDGRYTRRYVAGMGPDKAGRRVEVEDKLDMTTELI